MRRRLEGIFGASISAKRRFLRRNAGALEHVVRLIVERLGAGNKVLLFGNGGSASDAQHIAAEFVGRFVIERPPLAAVALTTDTSALTSIANDFGYDQVFLKQVQALGRPGDVAIALSTSGNSPSVLRAVEACRELGISVVAFTGGDGGQLGRIADHHLCVDATTQTARIQETHILAGHAICELVDEELFTARPKRSRGAARPARAR